MPGNAIAILEKGLKNKMEIFNAICHQASDPPAPLDGTNFQPLFTPPFSFAIESYSDMFIVTATTIYT